MSETCAPSSLCTFLEKAKLAVRDLPGFRSVREIATANTKEGQQPLQNGNWDVLVLELGVEDFYLTREGSIVRLVYRDDPYYPSWSVVSINIGECPANLLVAVQSLLLRASAQAAELPRRVAELLIA